MTRIFIILFITTVLVSCNTKNNTIKSPYDFVPYNSEYIYSISDVSLLSNDNEEKSPHLSLNSENRRIFNSYLKAFQPEGKIIISGKNNSADKHITIIAKHIEKEITGDSIQTRLEQTEKSQINYIVSANDTLYFKKTYGYTVASTIKNNVFSESGEDKNNLSEYKNYLNSTQKSLSLAFSNTSDFSKLLFQNEALDSTLFETVALDFDIQSNSTNYNGIVKGKDSTFYINAFKNITPQELNIHHILPNETSSFKSLLFSDYDIFSKNLYRLKKQERGSTPTILNALNQIASFKFNNSKSIALSALEASAYDNLISEGEETEIYKDISIYQFEDSKFFSTQLAPFINYENANYFFVLEKYAVFSNSVENLKSIINSKLNDKVLANSSAFKSVLENLADESSYLIYKNKDEAQRFFPNSNYNYNAVQFIYESHFAHVNASLKNYKSPAPKNTVTEYFSVSLPSDLILPPQTVKNHITKNHDIITQDVNNIMYLISNTGKILWTKQLDSKIKGEIEQIDTYKNGRLQLAFTTENRVYVLDRNGKDVGKFPLKFNENITQPLSVFDYDKKKNYRLLVTQNKQLLMYDAKGKRIKGFEYKGASQPIKTQPKHFRISGKDYIVFAEGTQLEIINRVGKTRIPVSEKIRFSDNDLYLYQNKFSTTNRLGELVQVNTKGKINKKNLKLTDNHAITATSKTLVSLSDNILKIRSRTVDLDFGNYTKPNIFYLNDKIYVSVTDKQSKKIYLFDSQAKSIPNFPVFGTSVATLEKLDSDRAIELIAQTDSKTITVYKIN